MNIRDIELTIVSTFLKSEVKRKKIFSIIDDPSYFFEEPPSIPLYKAVKKIMDDGLVVDIDTVISYCSTVEPVDIKEICEALGEYPVENIEKLLDILRRSKVEKDLASKYSEELSFLLKDEGLQFKDKVESIRVKLEEIESRSSINTTEFKSLSSVMTDYKGLLEERKKKIVHFTTGDFRLDTILTYGFTPGECTTIAGRPSNGKSYYALHLARSLANTGIPVALFNLEMRNASTLDRMVATGSRVEPHRLIRKMNELTEDEKIRLETEITRLSGDIPFYFNERKSLSLEESEREIVSLQNKIGKSYMVVMWDLFTKLKDFSEAESPYDIEKICNRFQIMYERLGIHAIPIMQINREADKEKIKSIAEVSKIYPQPSQIKNSDSFLEVSDNLLLVCRPSFYVNRHEWGEYVPPFTRVEVAKQRGSGDTKVSNILLYKNMEEGAAFSVPPDKWDPFSVDFSE